MKFCPFSGVSHHFSTILFGCALLANEDADSFIWLFRVFLKCMNNKAPEAILTDQCPSMAAAIRVVFPNIVHRFCLWHILKKLPDKIKGDDADIIGSRISSAVRFSLTISEFEEEWADIVETYRLQGHKWLNEMYEIKEQWVPPFLKNKFWAGMSTTQRSESVNAFFRHYLTPKTSLKTFALQYKAAVGKFREKESEEEYKCNDKVIEPFSSLEIEKQFLDAYTLNVYFKFRKEVEALVNVSCEVKSDFGNCITYAISDESLEDGYQFRVFFNRDEKKASCVCRLFEFSGIVCRHMLCVFKQEKVKTVERCYFLDRWRKENAWSYLQNQEVGIAQGPFEDSFSELYNQLHVVFANLVEFGSQSEHAKGLLVSGMAELQSRLENACSPVGNDGLVAGNDGLVANQPNSEVVDNQSNFVPSDSSENADARNSSGSIIRNPAVSLSKGRPPKSTRLKRGEAGKRKEAQVENSEPPAPKRSKKKSNASNIASTSNAKSKGRSGKARNKGSSRNFQEADVFVNEPCGGAFYHPARPTWNVDLNQNN